MTATDIALKPLVDALSDEVEHLFWLPGVRDTDRRRTVKLGTVRLVLAKHQEALFILRRILGELERLTDISDAMARRRAWRSGLRDAAGLSDLPELNHLTDSLIVDVKALYVWTADIYDAYRRSSMKIDLDELWRIRIVRDKLITHFVESGVFRGSRETQAGVVFGNGEFMILLHPFSDPRRAFRGVSSVVRAAKPFIPELLGVRGSRDQVTLMYQHCLRLPQPIRKDVAKLVAEVGTETEHPRVLAAALLEAIRQFRRVTRL